MLGDVWPQESVDIGERVTLVFWKLQLCRSLAGHVIGYKYGIKYIHKPTFGTKGHLDD